MWERLCKSHRIVSHSDMSRLIWVGLMCRWESCLKKTGRTADEQAKKEQQSASRKVAKTVRTTIHRVSVVSFRHLVSLLPPFAPSLVNGQVFVGTYPDFLSREGDVTVPRSVLVVWLWLDWFCLFWSTFSDGRFETSIDVCALWGQKRNQLPTLSHACRQERGGPGRSRTRSRLDWGKLPAVRSGPRSQSSPRQESVETVSVTKDRVPLRRSGAPAKKRPEAEAHPAGAVHFLRMRVASPRGRGASPPRLGGGYVERSRRDAWIAQPLCWWRRGRDRAACVSVAKITAAAAASVL